MSRIVEIIGAIKAHKGKKALVKALSLSTLNQMVSSGTNFVIVLYLVRVMSKSDFGFYSLGYAMMLLLAGLISSSITVQFVVNLPDQPQDQRPAYAINHAVAVLLLGIAMIVIGLFVSAIPMALTIDNVDVRQIALVLALSAAFYSLRDLLLRVAYAERCEAVVLVSTLTATAATAATFIYHWQMQITLTPERALTALAAGQAAGTLVALHQLDLPLRKATVSGVGQAFRESWVGGRWNIITNIVYNLRTQAHTFVIAPLLGMVALAEVNAARVLVTPAVMAIPPLTQVLMPRLADKRSQGLTVIIRYALWAIGGLTAFACFYWVVLLGLLPWALPIALGEAYQHVGALVMAWCLVTVVLALRNGLTMVLQVVRAFRDLLLANTVVAIVAILLAISLSYFFGKLGALIALAMAEILLSVLLIVILRSLLIHSISPRKRKRLDYQG